MKKLLPVLALFLLTQSHALAYSIIKPPELKISGYTQIGYVRDNSKTSTPANDYSLDDSFKIIKSRFTFKADIDPKVSMNVQIDVAAKDVKNNAINILTDAYFDTKFLNGHTVRFGQFKVPFGLENPISDARTVVYNTSVVKSKTINTRDIGIDIFGKTDSWEYHASVLNGAGANKSDDNSSKDFVLYAAGIMKKLRVGGSYIASAGSKTANSTSTLKHGVDGFVFYTPEWGEVSFEIISGRDKNSIKKSGWYALVVPQINPRTFLVARYEEFDPNTGISDDMSKTTLGLVYNISKYSKIKLNYEWREDDAVTNEGDALLMMMQVEY